MNAVLPCPSSPSHHHRWRVSGGWTKTLACVYCPAVKTARFSRPGTIEARRPGVRPARYDKLKS